MKTKAELDRDIIKITNEINEAYPELVKYILEMPNTDPSEQKSGVNLKTLKDYYYPFKEFVSEYAKTHPDERKLKKFEGYPLYPPSEDIYAQGKKVMSVNPSDLSQTKAPNTSSGVSELRTGKELDVPGAELDDQQEKIGSEDEENNYYSIGGDNHTDLDESKS